VFSEGVEAVRRCIVDMKEKLQGTTSRVVSTSLVCCSNVCWDRHIQVVHTKYTMGPTVDLLRSSLYVLTCEGCHVFGFYAYEFMNYVFTSSVVFLCAHTHTHDAHTYTHDLCSRMSLLVPCPPPSPPSLAGTELLHGSREGE